MPILTEEERVGTLLGGRYQLDAILGRGGTGVVFDATHNWTGRKVAVKLLKPEYSRDLGLTRRFLQEARAAAGLSHPNVVQVLDMGNDNDGTVHLVLERLEGESLGQHLETHPVLEPEEALSILIPIMDALRLAHSRGIIHRDLKPDNIYLHRDDTGRMTPKLLDFGMSKMVDAAWGHSTQSGTLIGTPFYMSPEQAEGRKEQGPACDVWSMGVILYRCLTGSLPFFASTPTKLLLGIVAAKPTPTAEQGHNVPPAFGRATDRCLKGGLDERWPSMEALIEALRSAAAETGVAFPALPDAESAPEPESFDPGPLQPEGSLRPVASRVGAMAAAVVLVVGAIGIWWALGTNSNSAGPLAAETQDESGLPGVAQETDAGADTPAAPSAGSTEDASLAVFPGHQSPGETVDVVTETQEADETGETSEAGERPTIAMSRSHSPHGENRTQGMTSRGTMRSSTLPSTAMRAETSTGTMRLPRVAEDW